MTTYYDYSPIVKSFIHQMYLGGWKIKCVYDCENRIHRLEDLPVREQKKKATEEVMAGDDGTIVFIKPRPDYDPEVGGATHWKVNAYIILGNGADELVADWSYSDIKANDDFEKYWEKHTKIWEMKKVPTRTQIKTTYLS